MAADFVFGVAAMYCTKYLEIYLTSQVSGDWFDDPGEEIGAAEPGDMRDPLESGV